MEHFLGVSVLQCLPIPFPVHSVFHFSDTPCESTPDSVICNIEFSLFGACVHTFVFLGVSIVAFGKWSNARALCLV